MTDMSPLAARVREFLDARKNKTRVFPGPFPKQELARLHGFAERRKGKPEMILAEDARVELGHPQTVSRSILLVCQRPGLVSHGRVSLVGPDLAEIPPGTRAAFAQIVLAEVLGDNPPDPFDLENAQYLIHRLPGWMARSVPGRLWVRAGKGRVAAGLTLAVVGSALVSAHADDFPAISACEVVFVTWNADDVEALAPLAADAGVLAGQNKKLALSADGTYECTDLDCDDCENQPVCDNLRDVVVRRRKL
jgi:CO dehydrogenase/acetyl-CoA synthase beta subunit